MESKYIGIIVERQDGKILFKDENYYIKIRITDDMDLNSVIEQTLFKELDIKLYKLRKAYNEIREYENKTPFQLVNDIDTMYLVEVCIYHDNFSFLTKEEIYENLYSCPQRSFYEKYFLRYEKYKEFIQGIFVSMLMIVTTIIIISNVDIFKNQTFKILIYISIITLVCSYLFLIPKLAVKILDYIINEKVIKYCNISSITIGLISLLLILAIK